MSEPIYIVFDGPPGPEGGRFVEVETANGEGRKVGEWTQHGEFWRLGPVFAEEVVKEERYVLGFLRWRGALNLKDITERVISGLVSGLGAGLSFWLLVKLFGGVS